MTEAEHGRVTIRVIADEAGVSVPTVSRVINGRSDVAPETRKRVEELLTERGYQRRRSTRAQSPNARLVDLVFNELDSPWAVEILRGVEDAAHSAGVGTVVSAVHRRRASTEQWLDNLRTRASDGVILVVSQLSSPILEQLRHLRVPMVVLDPAGGPTMDAPTIGATNWAGGLTATEHLIELGHRRIGFIHGPKQVLCSRARFDGYRAALEAAGIPFDPALVCDGDFYHQSGFDAAKELLGLDDAPTAIFASSDQMAFGAYEAIRQRGLRIPEHVSVVGFDDLPESRWTSPPLTTVRQPLSEMGSLAARTVLDMAAGNAVDSPRLELATEMVVRESTATPGRT
ncbi:LacI family DNA-binding transcriptional regulator [Glycomyces sp. L485]|uniref:LacI family DNA-binding transcriptional regulator n=1 Tax=Glycomyces sp. L485 TaxID=2909235 RepID=UPI001F4A23D5|nr:LacI family DNA-binding transcriptional regulator [Glycomyces sp. L485]MCH7229778.1 LacI family DNA-binding transcriptional regulator [Glycomyces sp. L485]